MRRPARPYRRLTTQDVIARHKSSVARDRHGFGKHAYEDELFFRAEDGDLPALEYLEDHLAPWM